MVGLSPIVRVADLQYSLIARALDCGAQGVIFPRVESPELLERAISWTKFPPVGIRGYGLSAVNLDYEKVDFPAVIEHMNANTMVVMQIETQRALDMREELLAVPGIDAVMVGPADLSISLGVPGEFQHPKMVDAIEAIRDTCIRRGVIPGMQTRTPALAKFWKERGMLFPGLQQRYRHAVRARFRAGVDDIRDKAVAHDDFATPFPADAYCWSSWRPFTRWRPRSAGASRSPTSK